MSVDFAFTGDLTPIIEHVTALAEGIDLMPLAEDVRAIMIADNARARLAGDDADDAAFAPVKPRTGRYKGLTGPPLAPSGASSRVVAGYEVAITPLGEGAVLLTGSWPSMPYLQYHVTGTAHMPARDPVGVTPTAGAAIRAALRDFLMGRGFS